MTRPRAPRTFGKDRPMPWWEQDFNNDDLVQAMPMLAEGIYRRLLAHQWVHGSIPADLKKCATFCKKMNQKSFKRCWDRWIHLCFVEGPVPGTLINRRCARDREADQAYVQQQQERSRLGNAARWGTGQQLPRQQPASHVGSQAGSNGSSQTGSPPSPTPTKSSSSRDPKGPELAAGTAEPPAPAGPRNGAQPTEVAPHSGQVRSSMMGHRRTPARSINGRHPDPVSPILPYVPPHVPEEEIARGENPGDWRTVLARPAPEPAKVTEPESPPDPGNTWPAPDG